MIANIVRMNSGRRKKEIILKGNKPIGWCRGRVGNPPDKLGASEINIYGKTNLYILMCFDTSTFPSVNQIDTARLYIYTRKALDSHPESLGVHNYIDIIPIWDNTEYPPNFNPNLITDTDSKIYIVDRTVYRWKDMDVTDIIKRVLYNKMPTIVLKGADVDKNTDFYVDFSSEYFQPYIDFTLK